MRAVIRITLSLCLFMGLVACTEEAAPPAFPAVQAPPPPGAVGSPPPQGQGPPPAGVGPLPGQPTLPVLRELLDAEALALEHARTGDPRHVRDALRLTEAVLARRPQDSYARLLSAWLHARAGDPAAEQAALAQVPAHRLPAYAYFFQRPTAEVIALLEFHTATSCHELSRVAPEGGTTTRPACPDLDRLVRPEGYLAFEQVAWAAHSATRVTDWTLGRRPSDAESLGRAVGVRSGARVADIGAGEGWFTLPFAQLVGPGGVVWAVEIDPSYLDYIAFSAERLGLRQVRTVTSLPTDVRLAESSIDVAFLCEVMKAVVTNADAQDDAYVAEHVRPFLDSISRALVPGGRMVVVDHIVSQDDPKALSLEVVRRLAEGSGLRYVDTLDDYQPMQSVVLFERPAGAR